MSRTDSQVSKYDAVIIGGGFYGCAIALYLSKERGFNNILLVEKERDILSRASYTNQARVHNGYHYPRSFTTAFRSRINMPKFIKQWDAAIKKDFLKVYAIARHNSKVTAKQFVRFCREIGANIKTAPPDIAALFDSKLIEGVFLVEEYAFNAVELAKNIESQIRSESINVALGTTVISVKKDASDDLCLTLRGPVPELQAVHSKYVFNCTYSGLNHLAGDFERTHTALKHEVTEMSLVKPPVAFSELGITVMDGPFFSLMPFPARGLHSLSHVRYTPHFSWVDEVARNPYEELTCYHKESRADRMIRDVSRYIPSFSDVEYKESIFEIKTVLMKSEADDSRPILYEKHASLPGFFSVLGGKIDNIYDVVEKLESENISPCTD